MTKLLRAAFAAVILALAAAPLATLPSGVSASGFSSAGSVRTDYTPSTLAGFTAGTGASFTVNEMYYERDGSHIVVKYDITVTAAGTASGNLLVAYPTAAAPGSGGHPGSGFGVEEAVSGQQLAARHFDATRWMIHLYTGGSAITTGYRLVGFYKYKPA